MEVEDLADTDSVDDQVKSSGKKRGCLVSLIAVFILSAAVWFLVRPGVFTVQPIGAIPEGVTIIYYSRGPRMPLFSSPDGMCLEIQRSVTLLCRMAAFSAVEEIADRIVVRLPYNDMAYLISTSGARFEK